MQKSLEHKLKRPSCGSLVIYALAILVYYKNEIKVTYVSNQTGLVVPYKSAKYISINFSN